LILALGCYFVLNYLKFAMFIEELRDPKYTGTHPIDTLENGIIDAIKTRSPLAAGLDSGRGWILKHCPYLDVIACAVYVAVSYFILKAALWLPILRH
jgi:hypothetical protein